MNPEGMDAYEMLMVLKRVLLPDQTRAKLANLFRDYSTPGVGVSHDEERWLRSVIKKHSNRIDETLAAEQRAKAAMNLERRGTSLRELQAAMQKKTDAERVAKFREERTNGKYGF
ncbi:hypothetical protein UFOVP1382_210 [uncultured Caudovirales phage]|uniref:Uncharacterized protein n=1 Tax=uncultured Caudovirales phage TaxID=2100421 RepID=A0A6J5S5E7_9CAUD|nr:hypothetical protein UFOVP1382_210 [uncultured Caudovirales phage]